MHRIIQELENFSLKSMFHIVVLAQKPCIIFILFFHKSLLMVTLYVSVGFPYILTNESTERACD